MKCVLAVLLFVGAALSNSTHRYAWKPQNEYSYRYESSIEFSIPQIKADQKSGLKLAAIIKVQAQTDYSLLIQLSQPRFLTFNGLAGEEIEETIPEAFKTHLECAFKVHMKRGVFEAVFVDVLEPIAVTNIKKAVVATLNMDLSASRRAEVLSNRLEVPDEETLEQSPVDQSYFTVREQSLHGDCQTIYNIHPLAKYEAMEIEQQLETVEKTRNMHEHLQGGLSQARTICEGKKYWQITKTRDFDNCIERPVFQKWFGLKPLCDNTKANCKDLMTHVSATNYIVCGNDILDFVIRKSITENSISTVPAWETEERLMNKAQIVLELLKQETVATPMVLPTTLREIKSLIFEYPEVSLNSAKPLTPLTKEMKDQSEAVSGVRPLLPMPDLVSAPKMLVPINLEKQELINQVLIQLDNVAEEIFQSPESCTSKGDVAGNLNVVAKALRALSLVDLKAVEAKMNNKITTLAIPEAKAKLMRTMFHDVIAMIGTNPAVMLVKEHILDTTKVDTVQAISMIQSALTAVRTPTLELITELITLVKTNLKPLAAERTILYNIAIVQTSNLIHKSCICPSKSSLFPERIFGVFCTKESEPVTQWIDFLKQELETSQNEQIKLNIVTALGKLGHTKAAKILSTIISNVQYNEMVRSLAVYSLQRVAKLEPARVKPILMTIIENIAERPEVRIAAVAVLPHAQPSIMELKMIAVRTWLEPSKEVASFIYSTLKTLTMTEVPELRLVGEQARGIITLVKPVITGAQYAHNVHLSKLVNYLEMVVHQEISWVASPENIIPARLSLGTMLFGNAYSARGSEFTLYTRGMDKWIDMIMRYTRTTQTSTQVREQLTKITEELGITQKPIATPELFAQYGLFETELSAYLNEEMVVQALEKVADNLNRDMQSLIGKKSFEITKALKPLEVEGLGPCDAGFPVFIERSLPIVVALKGHSQMELEEVGAIKMPKMITAKMVPIVNIKLEINMGVISPFTQEYIGLGVNAAAHMATPLEMTLTRKLTQIALDIKVPEEIKREIEVAHLFVTPFTVKKNLRLVEPISKAANLKPILSTAPLKKINKNIGAPLEMDARLIAETDAKYIDLYAFWEKISQHNPISLVNAIFLPSTIRMTSVKVVFNPTASKTKEVSLLIGVLKVDKSASAEVAQRYPGVHIEHTVSEVNHVRSVCVDMYPKNPAKFSECVLSLTALEVASNSVDSICQISQFPRCNKLVKICHEAKAMCEAKSGFATPACQKDADTCIKRILNVQNVHKIMTQLGNQGSVLAIRLDASLIGSSKALSTAITLGYKKVSSTPVKETLKVVSSVEVKTPVAPVYEIKLETTAEIPRVNNRWNTEQLLQQALQLILNGQVEYGYVNKAREIIKLKSTMIKSQEQIEAVRNSPEFLRCTEQVKLGLPLSHVCEITRHQATSIDEIRSELIIPTYLTKYSIIPNVAGMVKSLLIGNLIEHPSNHVSVESVKILAKINRVGNEAQLIVENNGRKYEIRNIRLPNILNGVLPISLHDPLMYTPIQKISANQIPASCRVLPTHIHTFDNKTYTYELNNCYHLLFRDCSEKIPVAVMAKTLTGLNKEVKILAGIAEIVMTPVSATNMKIQLIVKGKPVPVDAQPGVPLIIRNEQGLEILEIIRYQDNVYLVNAIQESLWVLFDGKNAEISGSALLRSRSCGLCGDLNGENTADLKTPERCIMSRPRLAAYSYMIQEASCAGIPSQDLTLYTQEKTECVKQEIIPTPLERLSKILIEPVTVKPLVQQHLVKRMPSSGKVCISKQMVKICSKVNKSETEEPKPIKVQRKVLEYVCEEASTPLAQQLEQRAKSGEILTLEVINKPVSFSKIEYEPVTCQRQI